MYFCAPMFRTVQISHLISGFCLLMLTWVSAPLRGQEWPANLSRNPEAWAQRVPEQSITVDGNLGDLAWQDIPAETQLREFKPVPFAQPRQETEVRFA